MKRRGVSSTAFYLCVLSFICLIVRWSIPRIALVNVTPPSIDSSPAKEPVIDPSRRVRTATPIVTETLPRVVGWTFPKDFQLPLTDEDSIGMTLVSASKRKELTRQKIQGLQSTLDAALLASKRQSWIPLTNEIPLLIHQTWKSHDVSGLKSVQDSVGSWKTRNPEAVHLLWNDTDIEDLMRRFYPVLFHRVYEKIASRPILKADLFRYMVLSTFGGVYADTDTECKRPLRDWIRESDLGVSLPSKERPPTPRISFIAGVEADVFKEYGESWRGIYSHPLQMCQWAMASRAGNMHKISLLGRESHPVLFSTDHPVLAQTLNLVYSRLALLSEEEIAGGDVIALTGPGPWTEALFWSWLGHGVDWKDLREFGDAPRVIGDQLVLPITGFSPGYGEVLIGKFGRMGSKSVFDSDVRVRHHWAGSWR
jgi:mannosyltransferase OCH1-like enzyme